MWGNWGNGMMGYWGWGGMAMGLGTIVLVIVAVFAARYFVGQRGVNHTGDTALQLLQKRYAKGEVTKEEYARIREDLKDKD